MNTKIAIPGLTSTFAIWSLANVFSSIAMFGAMGIFYTSLILSITFVAYCKIKNQKLSIAEAKRALPHALTRVLGLCFLSASLLYVKVGVVDTIVACNIFIAVCVLAPLQGEKFKTKILLPLTTTVVGVAMICLNGTAISGQTNGLKLLLPIGAMIALALSIFYWRKCSEGIPPTRYMTYMNSWVTIFAIPTVFALRQFNISDGPLTPSTRQVLFIALALTAGTIGDYMFSFVQKYSSFSLNSLIAPISAIFSSLFAWAFANQDLATIQIVGMLIVVLSISLASRINKDVRVETSISQEFGDELFDEVEKLKQQEISASNIRKSPSIVKGASAA